MDCEILMEKLSLNDDDAGKEIDSEGEVKMQIPEEVLPKIFSYLNGNTRAVMRGVCKLWKSIVEQVTGLTVTIRATPTDACKENLDFARSVKIVEAKFQSMVSQEFGMNEELLFPACMNKVTLDGYIESEWFPKLSMFTNMNILVIHDKCLYNSLFRDETGEKSLIVFPNVKTIQISTTSTIHFFPPSVDRNLQNIFERVFCPMLKSCSSDVSCDNQSGDWCNVALKGFLRKHEQTLEKLIIKNVFVMDGYKDEEFLPLKDPPGTKLKEMNLNIASRNKLLGRNPAYPWPWENEDGHGRYDDPPAWTSFWNWFLRNQRGLKVICLEITWNIWAEDAVAALAQMNPGLESVTIFVEYELDQYESEKIFDLLAFQNCKSLKKLDFEMDGRYHVSQALLKNIYALPSSISTLKLFGKVGNSEFERLLAQMSADPWPELYDLELIVLVPNDEPEIFEDVYEKLKKIPTLNRFFFSQSQVIYILDVRHIVATGPTIKMENEQIQYFRCACDKRTNPQ